jgi:hypothetical protein
MDSIALLRLALSVIADRLLIILALSMTCGLACWSMWGPSIERVATLAIFSVLAYLLTRSRKESKHEHQSSSAEAP